MNKEIKYLDIIKSELSNTQYLGDDCAYLSEYKTAISQDSLIEDVHFSLKYMTPYEIARKALLVNISDIAASGAKAEYALISLGGIPNENFIREFYKGINNTATKYDIKIIGGDLVKSEKIIITITIIGNYKNRNISSRKNAKEGYLVAVAGEFGSSALGLEYLFKNSKENYFTKYHKNPPIMTEISKNIATKAKKPYAMMDSSDGLVDCLYQISTNSNAGIMINYNKIPKKTDDRNKVLYGGEDYALVVCLEKSDFYAVQGLVEIGSVCLKKGVYVDNEPIAYGGFEHFE